MDRRKFLTGLVGSSSSLLLAEKLGLSYSSPTPTLSTLSPTPSISPLEDQYRGYIVDHHSPDPPAMTYENFDPEEHVRLYREAHLDHVWLFCKGHHGEAYYATQVGHMHPGLKTDFVKAISQGLRREGIAFHAYYSVGFDGWAVRQHPDWAILDEAGHPQRIERTTGWHRWGQWHWACVNSPYRQYVFEQLREIVKGYQPDGIFLDIPGQPLCYCKYCSALYHRRYSRDIPRGSAQSRYWREIEEFRYQTAQLGFTREVIEVIRQTGSKAAVTHNGGHLRFPNELQELFDYVFAEPWAGNYLSAMFARGTSARPQIGPGFVSKVYDPAPDSVFIAEAAMIVAQNCRAFFYSETTHQDGSLDPLWFRRMGAAFGEVEKIQPLLTERDSVPCVAVLYSEATQFKDPSGDYYRGRFRSSSYEGALRGAMQAAIESHFPADVLPDWKLSSAELARYQALILPEVTCLSDSQAQAVEDFVQRGGLLIGTGLTGSRDAQGRARANFALSEAFGCDFVRVEDRYRANYWGSYLKRKDSPLWQHLPDTTLAALAPHVVVKPTGARVLATHILPAIEWKKDQWINWEPPPPGKESKEPAILEYSYGKGRSIYTSFSLFRMVDEGALWPRDFLFEMLQMYLPNPPLRVLRGDGRRGFGTTFYRKRSRTTPTAPTRIIVHQVNRKVSAFQGDVTPLAGGTLLVSTPYFRPRSVEQVYPEQRALSIQQQAELSRIELPALSIHSVIVLSS